MPIAYRFLPSKSAVIVTASGVLALEDFLKHLASLEADQSVPPRHVTLFDARQVTELRLSEDDIRAIAAFTVAHRSRIVADKLAIVTRGTKEAALAAEYERFAASFEEDTIVFYNLEVACRWLDVPADSV